MSAIGHKTDSLKLRLDKWLWAARFYKTRALAVAAMASGKVLLNDERAKPSRTLQVDDTLTLRQGPYQLVVTVLALSDKRGPAPQAQKLYRETEASRERRTNLAFALQAQASTLHRTGKPSKKDRRDIKRFRDGSV